MNFNIKIEKMRNIIELLKGMVRYIQVVPEMTHLPDMEKAFERALEMVTEG